MDQCITDAGTFTDNAPVHIDPAHGALATASWNERSVAATPPREVAAGATAECLPDSADENNDGRAAACNVPTAGATEPAGPASAAGLGSRSGPMPAVTRQLAPMLDTSRTPSPAPDLNPNSGPPSTQPLPGYSHPALAMGAIAAVNIAKDSARDLLAAGGKENLGPAAAGQPGPRSAARTGPGSGTGLGSAGRPDDPGCAPNVPEYSDRTSAGDGAADPELGCDTDSRGRAEGCPASAAWQAARPGVDGVSGMPGAHMAHTTALEFAYSEACGDASQGQLAGQVSSNQRHRPGSGASAACCDAGVLHTASGLRHQPGAAGRGPGAPGVQLTLEHAQCVAMECLQLGVASGAWPASPG